MYFSLLRNCWGSLVEVRDSRTEYSVPGRDTPRARPNGESSWETVVAVTWKLRSTFRIMKYTRLYTFPKLACPQIPEMCVFPRNKSPCRSFLDIGELFRTYLHKINSVSQTYQKCLFTHFRLFGNVLPDPAFCY